MKRILIVEDQPIIASHIQRALEDAGFESVGPVSSEARAVELARDQPIDLALIDIRLKPDSESDGTLAGVRLAEELWVCDRIPCIFVTANSDVLSEDLLEKTGAFGLVEKPFSTSALLAEVRLVLNTSRAKR